MKRGLGARLEARFQPSRHWGGEFLADKVRLCALSANGSEPVATETFEGGYAEAEAFAQARGLDCEGIHAAVSHLPFKLEALDVSLSGSEEDVLPQAERMRPSGLSIESMDLQTFSQGDAKFLVIAREDALRGFRDNLNPALAGLWSLTPGPLALLSYADLSQAPERMAAILCEAAYCHFLFFRNGTLDAYAKAYTGWEAAAREPGVFSREMKKTLVYHFGSRFPGASLDAVQVWRDGPAGEVSAALPGLGIPQVTPVWPAPLASLPAPFLVAGALALQGAQVAPSAEAPMSSLSFTLPRPRAAEAKRLWLKRTGLLARYGYHVGAGAAIGVLLLILSALGLRWTVEAKAHTWSGELKRWDEFQKRKTTVEAQLGGMQGLLSRRTEGYADLQRIAGLLPPDLWLESWEMETKPGQGFTHRISGYSPIEARVPEFLANLEKARTFASVKLKSTERIKGEAVEEKTGIQANRKDLIHFEMGAVE